MILLVLSCSGSDMNTYSRFMSNEIECYGWSWHPYKWTGSGLLYPTMLQTAAVRGPRDQLCCFCLILGFTSVKNYGLITAECFMCKLGTKPSPGRQQRQTRQMLRLIRVFAGCAHIVLLVMSCSGSFVLPYILCSYIWMPWQAPPCFSQILLHVTRIHNHLYVWE